MKSINLISKYFDRIFARYYFTFIVFLFIFLVVNFIRIDWILVVKWDGWIIGDWLINYDLGFVRRGLSGEIIFLIHQLTGVNHNYIVMVVQSVSYFFFIYLIFLILNKKIITFWLFILLLTPGFLLFTYYDGMAVGRKEVLLYALFALWIKNLVEERFGSRLCILFSFAVFLLTLMHEVVVFYAFYFVLPYYFQRNSQKHKSFNFVFVVPIFSLFGIALLLVWGQTIDGTMICPDLLKKGVDPRACEGVVNYGSFTLGQVKSSLFSLFDDLHFFKFILIFVIILIPNALFIASIELERQLKFRWLLINLAMVLFSMPLFFIAADWGRWVSMHVTLSVLSLMMLLPESNKTPFESNLPKPALLWFIVVTLLVSSEVFLYSINHCCGADFINVLGPIKKITTTLHL